jgi:hypothetical protein
MKCHTGDASPLPDYSIAALQKRDRRSMELCLFVRYFPGFPRNETPWEADGKRPLVYTTIRATDEIHKGKKGKETEKMSAKGTSKVKEEKALEIEGQEQVRLVDYAAIDAPIETAEAPGQKSLLFMVRMYPEPLGTGVVEWRGQVNHVASGEKYPFRDWSRLIISLEEMLLPAKLVDYVSAAESSPSPGTDAPIETAEAPGQKSQLFTVRMTPGSAGGGKVEWQGQVNHVASGEGYSFRNWSKLIVSLERMLQPGFRTGHGVG